MHLLRRNENPNALVETKSFMLKVIVWVAMSSRHVKGPFSFRDENEKTLKINSDRYVSMLQQYFLPELREDAKDEILSCSNMTCPLPTPVQQL